MKVTYRTKIENGRITSNRNAIQKAIEVCDGKTVEISIRTVSSKRSNQQNAYWWGCVVPIARGVFVDAGHHVDNDGAHYLLCDLIRQSLPDSVLWDEVLINDTYVKKSRGTSELSKSDFNTLITEMQQIMSEWFNINVPDPNEQITIE